MIKKRLIIFVVAFAACCAFLAAGSAGLENVWSGATVVKPKANGLIPEHTFRRLAASISGSLNSPNPQIDCEKYKLLRDRYPEIGLNVVLDIQNMRAGARCGLLNANTFEYLVQDNRMDVSLEALHLWLASGDLKGIPDDVAAAIVNSQLHRNPGRFLEGRPTIHGTDLAALIRKKIEGSTEFYKAPSDMKLTWSNGLELTRNLGFEASILNDASNLATFDAVEQITASLTLHADLGGNLPNEAFCRNFGNFNVRNYFGRSERVDEAIFVFLNTCYVGREDVVLQGLGDPRYNIWALSVSAARKALERTKPKLTQVQSDILRHITDDFWSDNTYFDWRSQREPDRAFADFMEILFPGLHAGRRPTLLEVAASSPSLLDVPKVYRLLDQLQEGLRRGDIRYRSNLPFYTQSARQSY